MTDINPSHPLWDAATRLYEAWMQAGGLSTLFSETFECAPPKLQLQWLGIAQVAKDLFGGYQDDLVATLDRTNAVVRRIVTAEQWNDIGRALMTNPDKEDVLVTSEDYAAQPVEEYQQLINEVVGGSPMLTKSWVDSFPLSIDGLAQARIDALQRVVTAQLNELWVTIASELRGSRASLTDRQDSYNRLWGIFKEADDKVKQEMVADAH